MNLKTYALPISACCLLLGFLFPNHYFPWAGFYNEAPAGMGLIVLGGVFFVFAKSDKVEFPAYIAVFFLFALLPWLSGIVGVNQFFGDVIVVSGYCVAFCLAYIVGYSGGGYDKKQVLVTFAVVVVLAGFLSAVIGCRQLFGLNGVIWEVELPPGARPYANLAQPNQFSTLEIIAGLFVFVLASRYKLSKVTVFFLLLPLTLGLAMAQSRAGFLILFFLYFFSCTKYVGKNQERLIRYARVWLLWSAVAWLVWPYLCDYLIVSSGAGRVASLAHDNDRMNLWSQMLEAVFRRPFFGYGWNQVSFAQSDVVAAYPNSNATYSAHNIFLDFAVWGGAFPAVLLFVVGCYWLKKTLVQQRDPLVSFLLMVIFVLLIHAQLEFPLYYLYFLILFALILGVVDADTGGFRLVRLDGRIVSVLFVAFVLGFFGVVFGYLGVEQEIRELRFRNAGFKVSGETLQRPLVSRIFVDQFVALVDEERRSVLDGDFTFEEERLRRNVAYRFPFARPWQNWVAFLWLEGKKEVALVELRKIKNLQSEKDYKILFNELLGLVSASKENIPPSLWPDAVNNDGSQGTRDGSPSH